MSDNSTKVDYVSGLCLCKCYDSTALWRVKLKSRSDPLIEKHVGQLWWKPLSGCYHSNERWCVVVYCREP